MLQFTPNKPASKPAAVRKCANQAQLARRRPKPSVSRPKSPNPRGNSLLFKAMRSVFHMLNRMAVRAQHLKVATVVVFAVTVFVMHAKDFWVRVISALLTRQQQSSCGHLLAHGSKRRLPLIFRRLVDACFRAVLSVVGRRVQKFDAAVHTCVLYGAFSPHSFVVALRRTVFGLVGAASDVAKHCSTLFTGRSGLHSGRKRKTLSATVDCGVFSV